MAFRDLALIFVCLGVGMMGCTSGPGADEDRHLIGDKLEALVALRAASSEQRQKAFLYDEKVKRIHSFDVTGMSLIHSIVPKYRSEKHTLLAHSNGNYIIDMTVKHLAIYRSDFSMIDQPVSFIGTPKSAAFDQENGFIVIYDDRSSVAILKLAQDGSVESSWVGGPLLGEEQTISAGDIDEQKRLILSFSNNTIGLIDLEASLEQKQWVFTSFSTTLTDIDWVAPLHGMSDTILVNSENKLSVIDVNTQTILSEQDMSNFKLLKLSKSEDPHIVVRQSDAVRLFYVDTDRLIRSKTLYLDNWNFLISHLDLQNDTWAFIDTTLTYSYSGYNYADQVKSDRRYMKYRLSDLLAISSFDLPNETQLTFLSDYVFAVFPSGLGYAVRYSVQDGSTVDVRAFNFPYLEE